MEAFAQQTVIQGDVFANTAGQSPEFQPSGRLADSRKVLQIIAEEAGDRRRTNEAMGRKGGWTHFRKRVS